MCDAGRPHCPGIAPRLRLPQRRGRSRSSPAFIFSLPRSTLQPRHCPGRLPQQEFYPKKHQQTTYVPADRLLTPGKTWKLISGCCTQTTEIFCGDALPSIRFDAGLALKHLHRQTSRAAVKPGETKVLAGEKQRADGHQASPVPSGSRRGGHPLDTGARNTCTRLAFAF